ncbi:MAG: four-carbon acid sugar kinase family protein [Lachnospiraceae bacterium]|jgi:uncharacterized protein YgbK (DUF1537 family)|nr:four-carbon acid sugar kinase family protein [Lachnospiraceae bacterium]
MAKCVVIADDLTGANATGGDLKKMNYKAYTVMNMDGIEPDVLKDCDCILYPTDSRGVDAAIAYDRVYKAAESFMSDEVVVYGKRIDSTLRGNCGSETDAILDCLGDDYIAVVAPCSPASGRVVIGGYMLVNGVPLHRTDIASDPKCPIHTSEVAKIFKKQTVNKTASIYMKHISKGKDALITSIQKHLDKGARILLMDCVTQEDLDVIADAVLEMGLKFVTVDPGPFTATMARRLIAPKTSGNDKILAVVGTVNPNAKIQMEYLWRIQRVHNIFVDSKKLLEDESRKAEIDRVIEEALDYGDHSVVTITGDGIYPDNRIDFSKYMTKWNCSLDEVTTRINEAFAEIADRILEQDKTFKGMYTSGGDVTVSVCRRFEAAGIHLHGEVLPLAVYGEFIKGKYNGLKIITKGGSQGDVDAISRCILYMKEKLYI